MDAKRIAQLLAHGAHALQAPDEEAAKEGNAFAEEVRNPCLCTPKFLPSQSPSHILIVVGRKGNVVAEEVGILCQCLQAAQAILVAS